MNPFDIPIPSQQSQQHSMLEWSIRWLALLLAGLLFSLPHSTDLPGSAAEMIIHQALFVALASFLMFPAPANKNQLVLNCSASVTLLIGLLLLTSSLALPSGVLVRVGTLLVCLCLVMWSLSQLLASVLQHRENAIKPLLLLAVIILIAPIWLAPAVDLFMPADSIINGIISITPLTHFSVATGIDYLRSDWFYRNTPFGSLPFAYPSYTAILGGYLGLTFLLQAIILWRVKRQTLI